MKPLHRIIGCLVLVLGLSAPAFAQVIVDTTTLSSAITTNTQNVITLTAVTCTNCTFGQDTRIFMTDGEMMTVTGQYAAGSGSLTVFVRRGTDGTLAYPHANSLRVYYGPANRFHIVTQGAPPSSGDPHGTCIRGQTGGLDRGASILPWINVLTATLWNCDGSNAWYATNAAKISYSSTLAAGTQ